MNIGHNSRLPYDECAYPDKLQVSTGPLNYRLSNDQVYNCDRCLSTGGVRTSYMGHGVSTYKDVGVAAAQDLVDVDSIFKNLNVKTSKCARNMVNPVNPTQFKQLDSKMCGNLLNPEESRLSYPCSNYRGININRFYDLNTDPQKPVFWDFASNSRLEAKDNFVPDIPQLWTESSLPTERKETFMPCNSIQKLPYNCPKAWNLS